jgi:hypothetical protein
VGVLDGVDVKLRRARHHVDDLVEQVDSALARSPRLIRSEETTIPPSVIYRVPKLLALSAEWSAIVGDMLTNLRAALDHLACQLVVLDGQRPGRETSFPIVWEPTRATVKPEGWKSGQPGLRRADLQAEVEDVQPYKLKAADGVSLLSLINEFCNEDKHRELLIVERFPDLDEVWWGSNSDWPEVRVTLNPHLHADGDWVLRFDFLGKDPPPEFSPNVGGLIVVLDEGPLVWRTTPIQTAVKIMLDFVEDSIVGRFRPFFG